MAYALAGVKENWDLTNTTGGHASEDEPRLIRFTGAHHKFRKLAASLFLDGQPRAAGEDNPYARALGGKIVILGGTFDAARDRQHTPVGELDGIEILAHATQTYLEPPLVEPNTLTSFALDIALALLVFGATFFFRSPWDFLLSVIAAVALAVIVGYFFFNYVGWFFTTVGAFAGVPIGFLCDTWIEKNHLAAENQVLRDQLSAMSS